MTKVHFADFSDDQRRSKWLSVSWWFGVCIRQFACQTRTTATAALPPAVWSKLNHSFRLIAAGRVSRPNDSRCRNLPFVVLRVYRPLHLHSSCSRSAEAVGGLSPDGLIHSCCASRQSRPRADVKSPQCSGNRYIAAQRFGQKQSSVGNPGWPLMQSHSTQDMPRSPVHNVCRP
jgi:hypothetical protein